MYQAFDRWSMVPVSKKPGFSYLGIKLISQFAGMSCIELCYQLSCKRGVIIQGEVGHDDLRGWLLFFRKYRFCLLQGIRARKQTWDGGGGGHMNFDIGMCCCEGYGFQQVFSRIGFSETPRHTPPPLPQGSRLIIIKLPNV